MTLFNYVFPLKILFLYPTVISKMSVFVSPELVRNPRPCTHVIPVSVRRTSGGERR